MHFLLSPSDSCQRYCIYRSPVILTLCCTLPLPTLLPAQVFFFFFFPNLNTWSLFLARFVFASHPRTFFCRRFPTAETLPRNQGLFRNSVRSHCRNQGLNLVPWSFFQPQKSPSPLWRLCFQLVLGLLKEDCHWLSVFSVYFTLYPRHLSSIEEFPTVYIHTAPVLWCGRWEDMIAGQMSFT